MRGPQLRARDGQCDRRVMRWVGLRDALSGNFTGGGLDHDLDRQLGAIASEFRGDSQSCQVCLNVQCGDVRCRRDLFDPDRLPDP